MKINGMQIDGFGIWKGLSVDSLPGGMTLFYGRNEAGKTTLMQFVRTLMFGFEEQRRARYVPPVYGGPAGGRMQVHTGQGNFEVRRFVNPEQQHELTGDLVLVDEAAGTRSGPVHLASLLSGIDEATFNNVFAIGLREIQELGTLNSTAAAEHLYKLTAGLDRVSLVDVMEGVHRRRESLCAADPGAGDRLGELVARRQDLQREIDELRGRSRHWSSLVARAGEAAERLGELEAELTGLQHEARVVETAIQVAGRWQERDGIRRQIARGGPLPDPADVNTRLLDELNRKIDRLNSRMEGIVGQRSRIRREAAGLPVNRALASRSARVNAMCEHLPWIEALEKQARRVRNEIESIQSTIGGEVSGLDTHLDLGSRDVREVARQGFAALQASAGKLIAKREELVAAEDAIGRHQSDLGQFASRIESANIDPDQGLGESREQAARLVMRLRRRQELQEKIEKLESTRHDLQREIDDVVSEQVLPVGKLAAIGVIFVLGVVLAGFGLLGLLFTEGQWGGTSTEIGFLFMVLGAVFGLFSLALKHHWERVARDALDDFRHQFDLVRQQTKRARSERDEIDSRLPSGDAGQEMQLRDAESELTRLEDLIPIESGHNASVASVAEATRQRDRVKRELAELQRRWQEGLRLAGMSEQLAPEQLKEVTRRSQRLHGFHDRLEMLESEASDREKELAGLTRRMDELFSETGISYQAGDDVGTRLQTLRLAMAEQQQVLNRRSGMLARYNQLRTRYHRAARDLEKAQGVRSRLLAAAGARDEEEYRQFADRIRQCRAWEAEVDALADQIQAAIGPKIGESRIGELLDVHGQAGLEQQWESLQRAMEANREKQTQVHQQRGEFRQEIKALGEDRRLDEARLELNVIDRQIAEVREQWQVLAVSSRLLDVIRETWEAKRQPETLQEASAFLDQLTEGKYIRIWTRLTGNQLLVDNAEGETLAVEHLSRGTREAVYLGLRLALVDACARRGAVLPLVLDDVLVNFDANRARAAARVLRDFSASGYQVLMFTCHDHIRDLFQVMDVEIRVLPHHRDVVEKNATPGVLQPAGIETAVQPAIADPATGLPVPRQAPPLARVQSAGGFDPELEFELAAIQADQQDQPARPGSAWSESAASPLPVPANPRASRRKSA